MKILVHSGCSLLLLGDARGISVECLEGGLWLTQERDPRDHIMAAEERFEIDRSGRVVISSLLEAELVLSGRGRSFLGFPLWRARLVTVPRGAGTRRGDARSGTRQGRAA